MEISKQLYKGDNLVVLKYLLQNNMAGSVDLVYIDPPFASNNVFTVGGSTVSRHLNNDIAYTDTLKGRDFIEFLRCRLLLIKELLSDTGSIYLHTDYKVGHYVKVMMDEVFGINNFRNDITRIKCNSKNFKSYAYSNVKDMILFYSKSKNMKWNEPREELTDENILKNYKKRDSLGRAYTTCPLTAPGETKNGETNKEWRGMTPRKGRHWSCSPSELDRLDREGLIEWSKKGNPRRIIYAENAIRLGQRVRDIWEYKDPQYPKYPTEKNVGLLKRIITASSNVGDLVMDCFAGGGGTLITAQKLNRQWIGADCSDSSIQIIKERLNKECGLMDSDYLFKEM